MSQLDGFYSVAQAAQELRISGRTVRHRIKTGKIAATKLGPGTASYLISRAEVERVKAEDAAEHAARMARFDTAKTSRT